MTDSDDDPNARTETPVLVVGAGPVGLVLAHELRSRGAACVLAERELTTTRYPKMDITNGRSMELLRRLGLADAVRAVGVAPEHSFDVIFATGMLGREVGRWSLPSVDEARRIIRYVNDGSMSREPAQRISQALFEALLKDEAEADPCIDVRSGWRFDSLEQDATGVTSQLTDATSGASVVVRSAYVVACDGASSAVRKQLGIGLEGIGGVVSLAMVHVKSRDLGHLHHFGQFWHVYLASGAVIIAQDEVDTWTIHVPLSADIELDTVDPVALVQDAIGAPIEIDDVLLFSRWSPNLLVAESYRADRVFLAGDSAHQFIPTGGYGMNTGLGDAVDIGWKLAAVLDGWGGPRLLDSYEVERRPVGLANRDRSARHGGVIMGWQMRAADPRLSSNVADGEAYRAEVAAWLHAERGENESFGIEFDYRYNRSPVVSADDESPEPPWDPMENPASTWPGSRAPSVFLADGSALFDRFGDGFTLLVFGDRDITPWLKEASNRGVPFTVVRVEEPEVRLIYECDYVLIRPDGHVAWRGDDQPADPGGVLDRIRGS